MTCFLNLVIIVYVSLGEENLKNYRIYKLKVW